MIRSPAIRPAAAEKAHLEIREIVVDRIVVGDRLRQPTEEQIAAVCKSIEELGLRTPVTVRLLDKVERDGRIERGVPYLVAGATRLAAVKKLGHRTVAAFVLHDGNATISLPVAAIPASSVTVKAEHLALAMQNLKSGEPAEPIRVRQTLGAVGITYELVEGQRRLEAARRLGLEHINAVIVAPIDDELWEIDENLARAELTPAQIAAHMARRKELWEQKQVGQLAPPRKPQHQKGFAQDTADKTGQDKRNVNKAVARGMKIAPDVLHAVHGTKLDTGVALDRLAKMPAEQQREVARAGAFPVPEPAHQLPLQPSTAPSAHEQIVAILRQHIPTQYLSRLVSLAPALPAGTSFQMIALAALRDSGAGL
jgi:ParB-like chromosome segregation protein Spo0J